MKVAEVIPLRGAILGRIAAAKLQRAHLDSAYQQYLQQLYLIKQKGQLLALDLADLQKTLALLDRQQADLEKQ